MTSVFSENLRIYTAQQFKQSISDQGPTNVYLTIGKIDTWPDDNSPIQANTSVIAFNDVWKNMIAAKLITGSDVRHAIRRNDWAAGTVYYAYDHCTCSLSLFDENIQFYVLTSDYNVYKCLGNNNDQPSLIMPTQTVTNLSVQEQDGYVWKYMYTLTAEERLRFLTPEYMPVRTLSVDNNSLQWQVQDNAIIGGIEKIKVTNFGQNYSNSSTITVTITGDGIGATAIARPSANISNGIIDVAITNPGLQYTYANVIISDTGTGEGATARAIISPPGGHGSDPLRELGGSHLIINTRLKSSENNKIPVTNEYRQIALIQDPREKSTDNVATNTVYSQVVTLGLSTGSTNYIQDEYVYQGTSFTSSTFSGSVVEWDSSNNKIKLTNVSGVPTTDVLIGVQSTAARFVNSITERELDPYSGNLLYIDYIRPIQRATDQTEDFKIVLKF